MEKTQARVKIYEEEKIEGTPEDINNGRHKSRWWQISSNNKEAEVSRSKWEIKCGYAIPGSAKDQQIFNKQQSARGFTE